MKLYVLDPDGNPVVAPDVTTWGEWFEANDRHLGSDQIGDVHISTVFLGIDHGHGFLGQPGPVLWETMVFGGEHDGWQDRYTSRKAALAGHATALTMVRSGIH